MRSGRLVRAALTLVLSVVLVCLIIISGKEAGKPVPWWLYGDVLMLFLGAFCRLVAALFDGKLPDVSKKLSTISTICYCIAVGFYIFYFFALR